MNCGECSRDGPTEFYCCCEQIHLCKSCTNSHKIVGHYLLDEKNDIFNPYYNGLSFEIDMDSHILELIQKVKEIVMQAYDQIESGKYEVRNPNLPPVKFSLKLDPDLSYLLSSPISLNVSIIDENSLIRSFVFPSNELNENSFNPKFDIINYYLLEWNNMHVIVGGYEKGIENKIVYGTSPENEEPTRLAEIPENLLSFYPLIYENILYILGGRYIKDFKKTETNEIFRYDLDNMADLHHLYMKSKRFNIAACFHDGKLWILSNRCDKLEIIDLATKESEEGKTNVDIPEGSVLASDSEQLILMTRKGFYSYVKDFEFEKSIDFDGELFERINREEWSLIRPRVLGDNILFFGSKNVIYYSRSQKTMKIEEFNYNS